MPCPLCAAATALFFIKDREPLKGRHYELCQQCQLVHVPKVDQVSAAEEKAVYDSHENDPAQPGYRKFLSQVSTPMHARLPAHAEGLDFGSGPGPALPQMFAELGHTCVPYDLYYANHPERLQQTYDFITSTEVFEHLANPRAVIDTLLSCLKPGGLLGVMTQPWLSLERFKRWQYLNDATHISFYHQHTMQWLAAQYHLKLVYQHKAVFIFQTQDAST